MNRKRDTRTGALLLVVLGVSCLYVYIGAENGSQSMNPRVSAHLSAEWMWNDFDAALEKARSENKYVLIDFWAVWCKECKEMGKKGFKDPEVAALLTDFVLLKVDVDVVPQLKAQFAVGGLPVIVVVNAQGEEVARAVGYQDAEQLKQLLQDVIDND
ncbi:MAG: thioredoxin family protein [Theionarchaea archaeon]|nr:MAG: hypothetical protein AYK18_05250 [Theionarchaea archaeon DG-70]MBU7011072.1 thioredoxin family protein [Theionarchaea archaeon]